MNRNDRMIEALRRKTPTFACEPGCHNCCGPVTASSEPPTPTRLKTHFKTSIQDRGMNVKDSNGTALDNGDSVQLIKDLKVKGTSVTLKRGTVIKNIRLTSDEEDIECNADKVKGLVLKTCFLKKV
jgi:protein PhnA